MAIKMLKIDETKYWRGEISAKAARIFEVYIFDDTQKVHCCEMTPSYECHFVGSLIQFSESILESDRALAFRDVLESDIEAPDVQYFHVQTVDSLPVIGEHEWPEGQGAVSVVKDIEGETMDERIEAAVEYVRKSLP